MCDNRDYKSYASASLDFDDAASVELIIAKAGTAAGARPDHQPKDHHAAIHQIDLNLTGAGGGSCSLPHFRALLGCQMRLDIRPARPASSPGERLSAARSPYLEPISGIAVLIVAPGFFRSARGDRFKRYRPIPDGQ